MSDQSLAQAWQPFFIALAGASATLAGLVFIAMSLHPQVTLAHPLMRARTLVAASGCLLAITWSLIMLVPARMAPTGSLLLLAAGIGGGTCLVYQQVRVRTLGLNRMRVALGDPILLTPLIAGVTGLLRPASPLPFVLVAVATGFGLVVLFSQAWALVLYGVRDSDGPYRLEPHNGKSATTPKVADDAVAHDTAA